MHARGQCAPGTPHSRARPLHRPPGRSGTATDGYLQAGIRPSRGHRRHNCPRHTYGRSAALTLHRVGENPAHASTDWRRAELHARGRLARGNPPRPDLSLGVCCTRCHLICIYWNASLPVTSCQEAHDSCERNLLHVFYTGDAGVRTRELTSFLRAGADATCLHHTRMEVLSPRGGDCTGLVGVLCDLETSQCPRPVLVKEGAERLPLAREAQVRGRGRTRLSCSAIVMRRGAGTSVPSTRRAQGCKAEVLLCGR